MINNKVVNGQLTIKFSSQNRYALRAYIMYVSFLFECSGIAASVAYLPTKDKIFTLIRSPHVNKKSKEQFIISSYKCVVKVPLVQKGFLPKSLNYLLSNRPAGIGVRLNFN